MFQPLGGHLQAIKVHKDKTKIESSFLYGLIKISFLGCNNIYVNIKVVVVVNKSEGFLGP
jgi:hypothetical protein